MKMSTVLALGSGGDANQEVVRHLVKAELIQRERVPESQVEIVSIRFVTPDQAAVQAHISMSRPKAASRRANLLAG